MPECNPAACGTFISRHFYLIVPPARRAIHQKSSISKKQSSHHSVRTMTSDADQSIALLTCIAKLNATVTTSLHRSIKQYVSNKEYDSCTDGLDYLQVKNGMMISYLIDLTMLLRYKQKSDVGNDRDSAHTKMGKECLIRLQEMKVALDKMRPLEKRMRYQIDKLLALSTLGAGTFAAVRQDEGEEGDNSDDAAGCTGDALHEQDPLSFKPDLQGMMSMFEDDHEKVIYIRYRRYSILRFY